MIQIHSNFPLKTRTTFGVDVKAKYFAEACSADEMRELLKMQLSPRIFILGGGADILFTHDFEGVVISSHIMGINVIGETAGEVTIRVGSGVVWTDFVTWALEHNYYGIENLIKIPGLCGGAVVQNIGAYGVEVRECVKSVKALELSQDFKDKVFTNEECRFGYRSSIFKTASDNNNRYFITEVTFTLHKTFVPRLKYADLAKFFTDPSVVTAQDVAEAVTQLRSSKLPDYKIIGNAGSFFKNPVVSRDAVAEVVERYSLKTYPEDDDKVKLSAAQLIEKAGFKGYRVGDAGVSDRHSLILCNYGSASGRDILNIAHDVINGVRDMFGVVLNMEVVVE